MNKLVNKAKLLIIGACYGTMLSSPVFADDTEIYSNTGAISPGLQANVLLILDTSNSMKNEVLTLDPYDATIKYDGLVSPRGTPPCFDDEMIYRVGGSAAKNAKNFCARTGGDILFKLPSGKTQNWVKGRAKIDAFECDNAKMISGGAETANSTGQYTGRVMKYDRNDNGNKAKKWRAISKKGDEDAKVECEVDQGVHGDGGADLYATAKSNQSSPWTSVPEDAYDWTVASVSNIYTGNYLNYLQAAPGATSTRIETITSVMHDFINSTSGINLGFMPFSQRKVPTPGGNAPASAGGMVEVAIDDIENTRADIDDRLTFYARRDAGNPTGFENLVLGTPLAQTYYEAMNYYQGGPVTFGLQSDPAPSVSDSVVGGIASDPLPAGTLYESPISQECQKNYVIVLTDGAPFRDPLTEAQLTGEGVTDTSCAMECAEGGCGASNCLDHLAYAAGSIDQSAAFANEQVISTFTIAFAEDVPILNAATQASLDTTDEGESFTADNADDLSTSLKAIVADVLNVENTFSSPAVSVNAFNRAVHLDDLYFTLFKPGKGPHWDGNLKKYKLKTRTDPDTGEVIPFIEDSAGEEAIDPDTGFFAEGSLSYWSDPADADGKDVTKGGAVGQIKHPTFGADRREVYTYTDGYTATGALLVPDDKDINASKNIVNYWNTSNVTDTLLGIDGTETYTLPGGAIETYHRVLLAWTAGYDIHDINKDDDFLDIRHEMGDPLHSQPAIVQYGGTVDAPDLVTYVGTNDGYLHAIDTDDGNELWAFIPQELLPNLDTLFDNTSGTRKNYGIDGDVVPWVNDIDGDGVINGADTVYIFFGMRRGGNKIYAMNVTNRNDPQLEWIIDGDSAAGTPFRTLGQTWSSINVEQILDNGVSRTVLVFGGGYDDRHDNNNGAALARDPNGDSEGASVFIVDAKTGAHLWSASGLAGSGTSETISDMIYSIPARVKPLDLSGDGNMDRIYVADTGGQLFRIDIDESITESAAFSSAAIGGGRIADLTKENAADSEPTAQDSRRFYYPPDVAIVAQRGKVPYIGIAISSGYRAHPAELTIHDRIYLLKDEDVFDIPSAYTTLYEDDLYNATDNKVASVNESEAAAALSSLQTSDGWYVNLDDQTAAGNFIGEKGLAEPLIVEGAVIVSTFLPAVAGGNSCSPREGNGRVYFLDINDASSAYPSDNETREDRHIDLVSAGIPPSPNVIITDEGVPTSCIGTECSALDDNIGLRKTFWYEVEK